MPVGSADSSRSLLLSAISRLLLPVVRLCLRFSIQLPEAYTVLKTAFIEAATKELERSKSAASASRISAMTGVHRRDIAKLTQNKDLLQTGPNLIARIMMQWQHDRRFCSVQGKPRILKTEGKKSQFSDLVESVNGGDISAYAILYEMERMGIIELADGKAKLVWRDYTPPPELKSGLSLLAADTDDLFSTVSNNLFENRDAPNLHLKTTFDGIVLDALPEIRQWILNEGSQFHRRLSAYLSQFDKDLNPALSRKKGGARVAVGSFCSVDYPEFDDSPFKSQTRLKGKGDEKAKR